MALKSFERFNIKIGSPLLTAKNRSQKNPLSVSDLIVAILPKSTWARPLL